MAADLLKEFEMYSDKMMRDILEGLLKKKQSEIAKKYASSDQPFTDFIYTDEDYKNALEVFSILEFYVQVLDTISKDHLVLAFDILTETFKLSLATSIGDFKSPHKRGLHKCHQTLNDYRRNFYNPEAVKVSKDDVSALLACHLAILEATLTVGDGSLIHDHTSTDESD